MNHSYPPKVNVGGKILAIRVDPKLEAWGEYRADDKEIVLASRTLINNLAFVKLYGIKSSTQHSTSAVSRI